MPGTVRRFPDTGRVPQIGWNAVRFARAAPGHRGRARRPATTTSSTRTTASPTIPPTLLGVTEYSVEFCSIVARDNIVATQFHAEKSGELGLALLRGFADLGRPPC